MDIKNMSAVIKKEPIDPDDQKHSDEILSSKNVAGSSAAKSAKPKKKTKKAAKKIKAEKSKKKPTAASAYPIKQEKPDVEDVEGLYYIDTHGEPSPSGSSTLCERGLSPEDDKWSRESCSSPPVPPSGSIGASSRASSSSLDIDDLNLTREEQINLMKELSEIIYPENEDDANAIKELISVASEKILQHKIGQLPVYVQKLLAMD